MSDLNVSTKAVMYENLQVIDLSELGQTCSLFSESF